MAIRIEIAPLGDDTRARTRQQHLSHLHLLPKTALLQVVDIYTLDTQLTAPQQIKVAEMLANPVTHAYHIISSSQKKPNPLFRTFSWAIEIGYLPGVTDNIGMTAKQMMEDLLSFSFASGESVYTSQLTLISGNLPKKTIEKIGSTLANPLIQRIEIRSQPSFLKNKGMDITIPRVSLKTTPSISAIDLEVSDKELLRIGKQGIANADGTRRGPLALDLLYMKTIQQYFRKQERQPTDIELESLAQTWSEHCKHTIFADPIDEITEGLYRTYIKGATKKIRQTKGKKDICVSVFSDNSGAISFDQDYLITDKVETHNSPSALDPFGGAVTGIGGVNRDALGFGLGAKPVANRYGFCFAPPNESLPSLYRLPKQREPLLPPRRIMEGVIAGVNAGGNQAGIPTLDGFIYFDTRYQGKPLVFVGTIGLIPRQIAGRHSWKKQAQPGDYIVMVGGRVGADGIHGATFSSEGLDSSSPATAVQIGDPITQKKMSDVLVKEARDLSLYTSITDNGAGGLSCSVAEMARECGGCLVDLEKVPLKYPGLEPWQIWISESQERMTLSVPKRKWKQLSDLLKRRGVEATVIGTFTDSGRCLVRYNKKVVMDLEMEFLHNGLPARPMKTKEPVRTITTDTLSLPVNLTLTTLDLLSRPSLAGFSFISDQFDHTVQGGAVLGPLQGRGRVNAEATVFRPVLTSNKGVVLSHALHPSYSDYDTYHMAAAAIDSAIRSTVAAGANPDTIALLDNFCWCSATEPERLFELERAAQACYDYAIAYGTPFIAGKDSMFNDFTGFDDQGKQINVSIPPTLLISTLSVLPDHTKAVSLDSKVPGDLVYLLGETRAELGGSEYYRMHADQAKKYLLRGQVPHVDARRNLTLYQHLHEAIHNRLIASAISVSRGGLIVALAKTAIGGMLGMDIQVTAELRIDHFLFSESQGRIIVTVAPQNKKKFETIMAGCLCTCIGEVREDPSFTITYNKKRGIETTINQLHEAYIKTFQEY